MPKRLLPPPLPPTNCENERFLQFTPLPKSGSEKAVRRSYKQALRHFFCFAFDYSQTLPVPFEVCLSQLPAPIAVTTSEAALQQPTMYTFEALAGNHNCQLPTHLKHNLVESGVQVQSPTKCWPQTWNSHTSKFVR